MDSLDSPLDDALPMPAPDAPPAAPRDRRAAFAWLLALALCGCRGDQLASAPAFDPDSIPDAYAASTAALMWPGSTRAFQIRPDGDLYNGDWLVRFDASGDGRSAGPPKVIAFGLGALVLGVGCFAVWSWKGRTWPFEARGLAPADRWPAA